MRREVDAQRRLERRNALGAHLDRLLPGVAHVGLERVDRGAIAERLAVARDHDVEVERLHLVDGRDPLVEVGVTHVRRALEEEIAGEDDALLGEEHDDVAAGVTAPEEEELDLARAAVERHALGERDRRRPRTRLLVVADEVRHRRRLLLQARLRLGVLGLGDLLLHRLRVLGEELGEELVRPLVHRVAGELLARELVADDGDVVGKRHVPVGVIEVVVGVDHGRDRLRRDRRDRLDERARRRRRHVRVDHGHVRRRRRSRARWRA